MDALIDQINTKLGFNKIELVNDKEKVTNLSINNCNTGWKNFNTYTSLKSITLKNCIVDSDLFFNNLDNLEILRVDSNTYFKTNSKSKKIKFKKLKKFIFILPSDDELNFDIDNEKELKATLGGCMVIKRQNSLIISKEKLKKSIKL